MYLNGHDDDDRDAMPVARCVVCTGTANSHGRICVGGCNGVASKVGRVRPVTSSPVQPLVLRIDISVYQTKKAKKARGKAGRTT